MLRRLRRSKMIGGALTSLLPAVESATGGATCGLQPIWLLVASFNFELFFFLTRRQWQQAARLANRLMSGVRGSSSSSSRHAQMLSASGSLRQTDLIV